MGKVASSLSEISLAFTALHQRKGEAEFKNLIKLIGTD